MNGLVTSRSAVDAASCTASLATRVLWCTCTARYSTDKTTASEPINCEMALIASQFIVRIVPRNRPSLECHSERSEESLITFERSVSLNGQRCLKAWPHAWHFVAALRSTRQRYFRVGYFGSSPSLRTIFPRVCPVTTCSCAFIASESGNV